MAEPRILSRVKKLEQTPHGAFVETLPTDEAELQALLESLPHGSTVLATKENAGGDGDSSGSATSSIATPVLVSPVAGSEISVGNGVTLITDAFAVTDGSDNVHVSTDWKITSDAAGQTVVAEELASPDLLSHTFTDLELIAGDTYYAWARHNGALGTKSAWSAGVAFVPSASRHGELLYDTDGNPAAVIVGSFASGGAEPWDIRGQKKWLAVGLASTRGVSLGWAAGTTYNAAGHGVDISTIANVTMTSNILASSNTAAAGTGIYVSDQCTEANFDAAMSETETSNSLTTKILAYKADMQAAKHCRSVVLAGLGAMDLPSIDVLMRIYQARDLIDALDPTADANSAKKLSEATWGFSSTGLGVWSASEGSANTAWYVYNVGNVGNGEKYRAYGVCPVLEIDA